ncbi:MAG: HlyD family secretion protein, partial [Pirellulales bacterium]|nr:HlyD family secretion protein [Pirellulales bacterium]
MTAALDVAVQRINQASGNDPPLDSIPNVHQRRVAAAQARHQLAARLLPLIEHLALAPSRADAIVELVDQLAGYFPQAAVRCGIGGARLARYYDVRLGWLGPKSSLRSEADQHWSRADRSSDQATPPQVSGAAQSSSPSTHTKAGVAHDDQGFELHLPRPGTSEKCVVWVRQRDLAVSSAGWLDSSAPTIAKVFWSRPARSWPAFVSRLTGRSKWLAGCLLGILALVAVWPVHYRVACTATVGTLKQRLISAPFEASLMAAHVKPGDHVKAGDVLMVLDGGPLRIERESIEAEIQQASKEYNMALATGQVARAQQANLKRRQLTRRFDLLTDRLQRLEVVSPINGIVISGDLERYVGAPLQMGQTLMEVAPMDYMTIEIEIPEHEIGYVGPDAETRIKIDAVGGGSLRTRLDDLFPT